MTEEIELTRDELAALVTIDDATKAGKPTSMEALVSKRLEEYGYVAHGANGLISTPKGQKWIGDNPQKVDAYFKGEEWIEKQTSKGNWIKE